MPVKNRLTIENVNLDDKRTVSRILLGAVGHVLLIGCLNVSGLMLARGAARAEYIRLVG